MRPFIAIAVLFRTFLPMQAIVVGGGLAGVSAANTVLECGGKVVLVDKSAFCGGNSTKATSGINGAETQTQKAKKVEDWTMSQLELGRGTVGNHKGSTDHYRS